MRGWVIVAVVLALAGCAPKVPPGQVYVHSEADFTRLQRVMEPLLLANANICRDNVGIEQDRNGRDYCAFGTAVVKSAEFNAWTDGRTLFVSAIMLNALNNDELAGVLAHEMGHVIKGHVDYKKAWAFAGAFVDGVARGQGVDTGGAFQKLGAVVFNKDREREADRIGVYLMVRAGFDPNALAAFWTRMPPGDGGWLASHPRSPERADNVRQVAAEIADKAQRWEPLFP